MTIHMHPRPLKKAIAKFVATGRLRPTERRRFLRWVNRYHRAEGEPPLRRMPDGRVSLLELP